MKESRHLSHDEFFDGLRELLDVRKASDHGAIYLTQKRLSYQQERGESTTATDDVAGEDLTLAPILIRATDGNSRVKSSRQKAKLSTLVEPSALGAFYLRYAEVCKAGMTALKPRDRSKKKAKARKKKALS
ncbi:Signal recognition particle subunit srp14 [Ophiocordyceps camponoti-floridani]|uniref:Signal recognition particle subunit SRP14 n=1 Tax=Ophiocordyceps camponoti-floridani TaxID=2030778 RepID=A0A8H4Q7U2_9HYPO|nr:Signal recognition particle subunit srp14 [Ophiocordyceps camponoti-floridani]